MLLRQIGILIKSYRSTFSQALPDPPPRTEEDRKPAAPMRSSGMRLLALSTATRDYARRVDNGTLATARDRDLAPLIEAMGPWIWTWQRALRLTDQRPWRARPDADERIERSIVARTMMQDIDTWERAVARLDRLTAEARLLELPAPEPLPVPDKVQDAIARRREAARKRISRRRGQDDAGSDGPAPAPPEPEGPARR